MMHVGVEPGFRKAKINNIPKVSNEAILSYITRSGRAGPAGATFYKQTHDVDLRVDFVQIRKAAEDCEMHCVVFPAAAGGTSDSHVRVGIKMNLARNEVVEATCEQCPRKSTCPHIVAFLFWLHRKTTATESPAVCDLWGGESESLADDERTDTLRVRDLYVCDELRLEADLEAASVCEAEGQCFLDNVLDEIENLGLRDCALYRHCRSVVDEFEPLFVHHTLLDSPNNCVKDTRTFVQHMEDQAKQGLFERLADVSKSSYKSPLWLEAQYMRLRCSLIHRIASRKDTLEDEQILDALFCKDRECNVEERQHLKQHKRFILKQTEKLENKTYSDCGLLLCESYPYICAAPDGITDDHIVEIKAPKTEEEFEKYLEGRETIAPKYMAQIQIQMYMANVTKALYCVLSPTFDTNGALHYVWVQADMEFVASLLGAAEDFWKDVVFPRLAKIYLSGA